MISESELLQRARELNQAALGAIYDQYSPALYRYAARLLGNADAAEDCVAETFSRFLHALQNGSGPREHLQAYLYRVAHNWITDQWRRAPPPTDPLDPELPAHDGDPAQIAGANWERAQVRAALARLTPDQRQVIALKFIEDLENEEIAHALGKPVGAVKSLQHRALGALRRVLTGGEENVYEPAG